jgi:hypothetical protein
MMSEEQTGDEVKWKINPACTDKIQVRVWR